VTQEFEVTAEELVRTLQRRGIPLPSEIGAFVVLEACEKLLTRPTLISTRDIFITESGDVECEEPKRANDEAEAVSALLSVLAELLVCAAPGVPNMLLDLVEHGPNEERLSLALLRSDLEACLLPLNRGAQRRVLSRLVREVRKSAPGAPGHVAPVEVGDVDATFDDLLGETSPPPGAAHAPELPRGIGSGRAAGELPRGVSSSRPADNKASSEVSERSVPLKVEDEVTRHHEVTSDERGRAARRVRTPADGAFADDADDESGDDLRAGHSERNRGDAARARRAGRVDAADGGESSARPTGRSERNRSPSAADRGESRRRGDGASDNDGSRRAGRPERDGESSWGVSGRRSAEHGGSTARASGRSEGEARRTDDGAASMTGRGTARPERDRRGSASADAARPPRSSERPSRGAAGSRSRAPVDLDAMVETNGSRGRLGMWVFLGTTAAAVAMLLGYFALGREQSQSALGFLRPTDGSPEPAKPAPVPRRAYGDLRVNSQPDRAQVLLLLGPGPALATDIPLGVAQEFIAMAEGYRPARALLPADGIWDELNGRPRYELAIQARPFHESRKPHNLDALGPTLLPQNVGAPSGRLGSVRVVTTPRAAEVYQLIGFTPEVHVDNLPLDHAYELVIYAEGHKTARKHLEPSDFIEQDGKRVARIDVQLSAAD